ncbi:hypothetical protein TRVL_08877 [Trypanosoma vivax]|nr:hypothetical protein TRVL_08877 [Trypanosoma vivax]
MRDHTLPMPQRCHNRHDNKIVNAFMHVHLNVMQMLFAIYQRDGTSAGKNCVCNNSAELCTRKIVLHQPMLQDIFLLSGSRERCLIRWKIHHKNTCRTWCLTVVPA